MSSGQLLIPIEYLEVPLPPACFLVWPPFWNKSAPLEASSPFLPTLIFKGLASAWHPIFHFHSLTILLSIECGWHPMHPQATSFPAGSSRQKWFNPHSLLMKLCSLVAVHTRGRGGQPKNARLPKVWNFLSLINTSLNEKQTFSVKIMIFVDFSFSSLSSRSWWLVGRKWKRLL